MPFYLICDVSLSMRFEMEALHAGVTRLWEAIVRSPVLDDGTRVCIMTFSDDVKIPVPLTRMTDYRQGLPEFECEQLTDYGEVFRVLSSEMARDYIDLKRLRYEVYRPCVYFLTGGEPNDWDWYETFLETMTEDPLYDLGMPEPPVFVPFGFRDAPTDILAGSRIRSTSRSGTTPRARRSSRHLMASSISSSTRSCSAAKASRSGRRNTSCRNRSGFRHYAACLRIPR